MKENGSILHRSSGDSPIQAFPLRQNYIALTSTDNPVTGADMVRCVANGDITITFVTGGSKNVTMVEGDVFSLPDNTSIDIGVGTFHFC